MRSMNLSFELFPPTTPIGTQNLMKTVSVLSLYCPEFVSVTYGASGSDQEKTNHIISELLSIGSIDLAPHLTCIGASETTLRPMLDAYVEQGIRRLVVLRGDVTSTSGGLSSPFRYASDLVRWINEAYPNVFSISVACYPETHPESLNANCDFEFFLEKASQGVESAITQYFYNPDAYECFLERLAKVNCELPIIPGIMPISNLDSLIRFSARCGAELPRWLLSDLSSYQHDPRGLVARGVDIVANFCEKVISLGAPGLHFYTLNKSETTAAVINSLNLEPDVQSV